MAQSSKVTRRAFAALIIGISAFAIAMLPRLGGSPGSAMTAANNLFYDVYYHTRPIESRQDGPVIIVDVDDGALQQVNDSLHFGWPWPRDLWGNVVSYLSDAGAKVVVFDIIFSEASRWQTQLGDDDAFADAVMSSKVPVVFGSLAKPDGAFAPFHPPIRSPQLAAVNVGDGKIYRQYAPVVFSKDSLAATAVKKVDPSGSVRTDPFLLHYYGPYNTYRYVPATNILDAVVHGREAETRLGMPKEMFKGKVVVIGVVAAGTFDLKASPLSDKYPGVEVQATAIDNLLAGESASPLPAVCLISFALFASVAAALGVVMPRRATFKLLVTFLTVVLILGGGIVLFRGHHIHWYPPGESLLAVLLATPTAFTYTYLAEDRQRRFMLKALSKIVSPAVAEQLARNPERLALGTVRTELTVLFTDLANFTEWSEAMDVQQLGETLNQYLGFMSDEVLKHNGTLDKYIGDAVMCFWNAPLPQADHAILACRAALAMDRCGQRFSAERGGKVFTRIGINTTSAAVGFVGSSHLFNYTALGDGINLASRLEGANKLYGTRILLSEQTADLVRPAFHLREIDGVRVKGKSKPASVYELLAERDPQNPAPPIIVAPYEKALAAYQRRDWESAEQVLLELCAACGDDSPSRLLLKRIATLRHSPPPVDWDGTYDAKEK